MMLLLLLTQSKHETASAASPLLAHEQEREARCTPVRYDDAIHNITEFSGTRSPAHVDDEGRGAGVGRGCVFANVVGHEIAAAGQGASQDDNRGEGRGGVWGGGGGGG
jgi:hypothetical protein